LDCSEWSLHNKNCIVDFRKEKKNFLLEIQIPKCIEELNDTMRNVKIASAFMNVKCLKGAKIPEVNKEAALVPTFFNETEELKDNP